MARELELLEVVGGASEWRDWLAGHHLTSRGVWLVFLKKGAGRSISYEEALDEALAYGWIDSLVKRVDDMRYARKFTPRKPSSAWSGTNIRRAKALKADGRMTRWGLAAFYKRKARPRSSPGAGASEVLSELERALKPDSRAWRNFESLAPSYRRRYLVWIAAAKEPETRRSRTAEAVGLISRNVKGLLK